MSLALLAARSGVADASTTGRAVRVCHPVAGTSFGVGFPDFIAIEHDLVAKRDGITRTFAGAFQASLTKGLEAKINRFVDVQWDVCCQHHRLEPWADKRIEDEFTNAAQLPQSGEQDQWNLQDITIGICLGARRKPKLSEMMRHYSRDFRATLIPAHGLGPGYPVVTTGTFHGFKALIDQHNDRVAVIHLNRRAIVLVGVPGIARHLTDTCEV